VKCGQPVPAGHKFCGSCGTTQEVVCASCNAANPGNLKFCGNCGKPLSSG